MDTLLLINLIAFIAITAYGLFLFLKAVVTRVAYMKLGKEAEFDLALKERLRDIIVIVFGQSKLLKDKISGIINVKMFYGFIFVQCGGIDMFIKESVAGWGDGEMWGIW